MTTTRDTSTGESKPEEPQSSSAVPDTHQLVPHESKDSGSGSLRNLLKKLAESSEHAAHAAEELSAFSPLGTPVGKILAGKYEIIEKVGQGGMGAVFKARDILLDRFVAVKLLNPSLSHDERSLDRFHREAQLVSKLSHPNAIGLYEFGVDGILPFLVMAFVDGESLEKIIKREGPFPLKRAVDIINQVSDALSSAHRIGIVHRDLKPDNIMVSKKADGSDWISVLDFGMAKLLTPENPETRPKLSSTGVPCGTPHYMSPELVMAKEVDMRADVYALGIIAFQMLAGVTPFEDLTTIEILFHQFNTIPKQVREIYQHPEVTDAIEGVIACALEKLPDKRYQSALDFAQAFEAVSQGKISQELRIRMRESQTNRALKPATAFDRVVERWQASEQWQFYAKVSIVVGSIIGVIWAIVRWSYVFAALITAGVLWTEQATNLRLTPLRSVFSIQHEMSRDFMEELVRKKVGRWKFKALMMSGIDVDLRDQTQSTVLHVASEINSDLALQQLIASGADVTATNNLGQTPLFLAARAGNTGIVYSLIEAGAKADAADKYGVTPLIAAVAEQHLSSVHALVSSGAALNVGDTNGFAPLHAAAGTGNDIILQLLLDKGATVNAQTNNGRTPLMIAAEAGKTNLIQILLKRGALLDMKDSSGQNALSLALGASHAETADVLTKAGAK